MSPQIATEPRKTKTIAHKPTRAHNGRAHDGHEHLSPGERVARGKAARNETPRANHAHWSRPAGRREPAELLEEQAKSRVSELVPIRHGRMLVSPFTFYRGAAYIMAADLASTPTSGLRVQLCGDAHLSNFGGYASPERRMVFDVNDFDETAPGPWEWDVKRLAASFEVLGRYRGFSEGDRRRAILAAVESYREAMLRFAEMRDLDVWYAHMDIQELVLELERQSKNKLAKGLERNIAKAQTKNSLKAFAKLTHLVDGQPRILADPPLVVPIADLMPPDKAQTAARTIRGNLQKYSMTLSEDHRALFEHFRYQDLARKVVGVGSVGTRAWIVLMLGRDDRDPLFLQVKEAEKSVLEPFAGKSVYPNHGERVVEGQRLMQSVSDIFLGWLRATGIDGVKRDFYVRQLWDQKASADTEAITIKGVVPYARMCGSTLARAHARTGDRIAIAAYLGMGSTFDKAIADFSGAYADQNQADYDSFRAAVKSGRLQAKRGL